jgi:hypothetical protein
MEMTFEEEDVDGNSGDLKASAASAEEGDENDNVEGAFSAEEETGENLDALLLKLNYAHDEDDFSEEEEEEEEEEDDDDDADDGDDDDDNEDVDSEGSDDESDDESDDDDNEVLLMRLANNDVLAEQGEEQRSRGLTAAAAAAEQATASSVAPLTVHHAAADATAAASAAASAAAAEPWNRDAVLTALRLGGMALSEVTDPVLRGDFEVAEAAVMADWKALADVPLRLRNSRPLVEVALRINGTAMKHVTDRALVRDRGLWMLAVGTSGSALSIAPPEIKDDIEVVRLALAQNGHFLMHASKKLRENVSLAISALKGGANFAQMPFSMKNRREVALAAVKTNGLSLQHVPDRFRLDPAFVAAAAAQNPLALAFAPLEVRLEELFKNIRTLVHERGRVPLTYLKRDYNDRFGPSQVSAESEEVLVADDEGRGGGVVLAAAAYEGSSGGGSGCVIGTGSRNREGDSGSSSSSSGGNDGSAGCGPSDGDINSNQRASRVLFEDLVVGFPITKLKSLVTFGNPPACDVEDNCAVPFRGKQQQLTASTLRRDMSKMLPPFNPASVRPTARPAAFPRSGGLHLNVPYIGGPQSGYTGNGQRHPFPLPPPLSHPSRSQPLTAVARVLPSAVDSNISGCGYGGGGGGGGGGGCGGDGGGCSDGGGGGGGSSSSINTSTGTTSTSGGTGAKKLQGERLSVMAEMVALGGGLAAASEEVRDDKEVVVELVGKLDGLGLEFASPRLQGNRDVVRAAVGQAGRALQFASAALKADREVSLCDI